MALKNKNSMLSWLPGAPPWFGPRENFLIFEGLTHWKIHS